MEVVYNEEEFYKEKNGVNKEYYNRYLNMYLESHNGLKYSKVAWGQKELYCLAEHEK